MTHREYVLICIGHQDKSRRIEASERRLNYHIVKGWADPRKFTKSMEQWWQISGESIPKVRVPNKSKLLKLEQQFRNLGKNG